MLLAMATLARAQQTHTVRSDFEPGATGDEVRLVFQIDPDPSTSPVVRWLAPTSPRPQTVEVQRDAIGRYTASLSGFDAITEGRIQIEIDGPDKELLEIHQAGFAVREVLPDAPSTRPSQDGNLAVAIPDPEGLPEGLRLLIGHGERPFGPLPDGVDAASVVSVDTVDLLDAPGVAPSGWQLVWSQAPDARLYYQVRGGTDWDPVEVQPIDDHPLMIAALAGPGTYLVARVAR
jgi:hypothetical protein